MYEVADVDYIEAVTLAQSFTAAVAKLPAVSKLTTAWKTDVENLSTVYNSLTSYQKSFIDSDTLTTFNELVAKMKELTADSSDSATDSSGSTTDNSDSTTDSTTDGTESNS